MSENSTTVDTEITTEHENKAMGWKALRFLHGLAWFTLWFALLSGPIPHLRDNPEAFGISSSYMFGISMGLMLACFLSVYAWYRIDGVIGKHIKKISGEK